MPVESEARFVRLQTASSYIAGKSNRWANLRRHGITLASTACLKGGLWTRLNSFCSAKHPKYILASELVLSWSSCTILGSSSTPNSSVFLYWINWSSCIDSNIYTAASMVTFCFSGCYIAYILESVKPSSVIDCSWAAEPAAAELLKFYRFPRKYSSLMT